MGMFALESKPFTKMVLFSYTLFTWLNAAVKRRGVCYILSVADVETYL